MFAGPDEKREEFPFFLEEVQAIRHGAYSENKIHNLKLAAEKIERLLIEKDEIFSFWKAVGFPDKKNGYSKGRNLVEGQLAVEYGGGLCQLSGMIYILSLRAGFSIIERHAHSLDIYTEQERFTPLGADATVAYAYKDLRVMNPGPFAVKFRFDICGNEIKAYLCGPQKICEQVIRFETKIEDSYKEVFTYREGSLLNTSTYGILQK
jgi:vancomycin resistance protein VanW